jgi:hypothetical protein
MAMLSAVGTLVSVFGQMQAGKAQADIAEWNAARAREQARREKAVGFVEAQIERREGERLTGKQRALLAEGGAALGEGTPLLIQQETAAETDFRARVRMANASSTAQTLENRARAGIFEGKLQQQAATIGAGASLLSGFSKFGSSQGWFGQTA